MGDRKTFVINQIVKYSQKLDQKGFGANHDGNISVKLDDTLLATPTAVSKGDVVADMVITLDMAGNKIAGSGKPFSEIKIHLAAYKFRSEVKAVIHAHPPFATARGLVGLPLQPVLPEAIVSLGDNIPVAEFAMPGDKVNDDIVRRVLDEADVFMWQGNGVFAVGDSLEQAYLRLELVEHLAKIQYYADQMGTSFVLDAKNVATLLDKRAAIGLGPKAAQRSSVVPQKETEKVKDNSLDSLKKLIADEIKTILETK
jgi:L-fuculose-phosphate aldolase